MAGVWIGIDGGGSKTEFMSVTEDGIPAASWLAAGSDYHEIGMKAVGKTLAEGVRRVLPDGASVRGICFGMPTFGENGAEDFVAVRYMEDVLHPFPLHVVNDVEAGWAASLALNDGVNIVAGTGSIAYGRDKFGNTARCGGWMEFFSDEGSCYWLGRRALELFAKESDGRKAKGPLYELMKRHLCLQDDYEINSIVREKYAPSREKTASLQRILAAAAMDGDVSAAALYQEAGQELAMMVETIIQQLSFETIPRVSYSGGLFSTGDLILHPFQAALTMPVRLEKPLLMPVEGAVLLATEHFAPQEINQFRACILSR